MLLKTIGTIVMSLMNMHLPILTLTDLIDVSLNPSKCINEKVDIQIPFEGK